MSQELLQQTPPLVTHRTLLAPGSYLAEIQLARPCAPDLLNRALEQMGWCEIYPDLSVLKRPAPHVRLIGKTPPPPAAIQSLLFLGRVAKPFAIRNAERVTWSLTHRFKTWDPYEDVARYTVKYFRLLTGARYEIRFLSRALPGKSSRENVTDELRAMGWAPERLTSVKKNTRIPKRSAADMTLWLGIGRWVKAKSYTTGEEPFYFEDVVPLP